MPQIKMPNGDMVQFPDDMPKDQIQGMIEKKFPKAGDTKGGDLVRGLIHGASMGQMGEAPEKDASGWRTAGENIGNIGTTALTGLVPGGPIVKGALGAGVGAMQPADSWKDRAENAGIGALSAYGGGRLAGSPRVKTALDHLANMGLGMAAGKHLGEIGPWGGMIAGRYIGRELEHMFGGGLGDLMGWLAKNPGLAATMGIKLGVPAANEAGKIVGDELAKPSQ